MSFEIDAVESSRPIRVLHLIDHLGTGGAQEILFEQVLSICGKAGLVRLGHVSLDGTKIKADASMSKAMSYGRIGRALCEEAERIDAEEDALYGDSTPYEFAQASA